MLESKSQQAQPVLYTERNLLQELTERYESHPVMRGIIAGATGFPLAGPILGGLDAAILAQRQRMKAERFKLLLEEFEKGTKYLTEEIIQQEDFLHAFDITTKAVVNTRRREKIKLFARLLTTACREQLLGSEEYDEFLRILDDLSYRELKVLLLLRRFEVGFQAKIKILDPSDIHGEAVKAWKSFQEAMEKECNVPIAQQFAFLVRLTRTGLCEVRAGNVRVISGTPPTMGDAYLTSRFFEFARWLERVDDGNEQNL